jgi:hypothetical protein
VKYRASYALLLGTLVLPTADHPLHTTLTEIIQANGIVTVTVRGFADDLTLAASGHTASTMSTGAADSSIARYLGRKLVLAGAGGAAFRLDWTSVRRQADVAWFTYRTRMTGDLRGVRIGNSALCELYDDQVNIVQVTVGKLRRSLLFSPGDAPKRIP